MKTFNNAILEQCFTTLFTKKYFDIQLVQKIGELLGVNPKQHENYKLLETLHCVDYSDMSHAIKSELQQKVMECLRPQFQFTAATLTKALLIEGNDHIRAEDEVFRIGKFN